MDLPKSIEVYEDECAAVLSWLSETEWLRQDEFDRRSREWTLQRLSEPVKLHRWTGETILPPMNGDLNVAILQEMCRAGLVVPRGRVDGKVEYRLAPSKQEAAT